MLSRKSTIILFEIIFSREEVNSNNFIFQTPLFLLCHVMEHFVHQHKFTDRHIRASTFKRTLFATLLPWRVDPKTHCDLITAVSNQIPLMFFPSNLYLYNTALSVLFCVNKDIIIIIIIIIRCNLLTHIDNST